MILNNRIKDTIINDIVKVCKKEIKENNNKELLGLTVNYFYDGEVIDIGCVVHIFDNNKDEGYTKYISFTLNEGEININLLDLLNQYDINIRFNKIKKAASEIKEYLEAMDWGTLIKISEDMFIDLELYD